MLPDEDKTMLLKNRVRNFCSECTPCNTTDKENEELSKFSMLDSTKTKCGTCSFCTQYTEEELSVMSNLGQDIPTFEDCTQCEICEDCKNGIGLESPPGLRGHTMLQSSAGILVYGGATWTMTNFTI